MTRPTIEALDEHGSIVQSSTRHFPGIVSQGDSTLLLLQRVDAALAALREQRQEDALDDLEEIKESLVHALKLYVSILDGRGQPLPFMREEFERLTSSEEDSES